MKMRLPVQFAAMLALQTLLGTSAAFAAPTTTNGQISEPGERDRFSFRLDAERTFFFDALTQEPQLQWSLVLAAMIARGLSRCSLARHW